MKVMMVIGDYMGKGMSRGDYLSSSIHLVEHLMPP